MQTRRFLAWFRQMVLSYIHVDGEIKPRRVTVVHGGLHPRRVHEEATLSIPSWPSPTKDLPHLGRSSRSRQSPCPYKLLGSTPQSCWRLPRTPIQSRRHHSARSNKWCVDDELLALVLQMIVSPTLNSLSSDLDLVERRFEWKATWGWLEIKIHMVGMEYLGLNT